MSDQDTDDVEEARDSTSRILDLDRDGVPDAVETVSIQVDPRGPGRSPSVEIVDEVDAQIDDDGTPHRVEVERLVVTED